MNILQKAAKWFNPTIRSIYQFVGNGIISWLTANIQALTEEGYVGNSDVYAIIDRICVMGSPIPIKVQTYQRGKAVDLPEHELQLLLENPNPEMTGQDFMEQAIGFHRITGEVMIFMAGPENGPNKGKPKELWIMNPNEYEPVPEKNSRFGEIIGFSPIGQPDKVIPAELVIFSKTFNPLNRFRGLAPMAVARKRITLGNSQLEDDVRTAQTGGIKGILSSEVASEMTEEQGRFVQRQILNAEQSRGIVVSGKPVKWQSVGQSDSESRGLEKAQFNRAQLCNIWRMPSELFNDDAASTYNNMQEIHKAAYVHGVLPVVNAIIGGFNKKLAPKFGPDIWLYADTSGIEVLQENLKDKVEMLRNAYWIPVAKKQELMGLEIDPALEGVYCDPTGQRLFFEADEVDSTPAAVEDAAKHLSKLAISEYGITSNSNGKH